MDIQQLNLSNIQDFNLQLLALQGTYPFYCNGGCLGSNSTDKFVFLYNLLFNLFVKLLLCKLFYKAKTLTIFSFETKFGFVLKASVYALSLYDASLIYMRILNKTLAQGGTAGTYFEHLNISYLNFYAKLK